MNTREPEDVVARREGAATCVADAPTATDEFAAAREEAARLALQAVVQLVIARGGYVFEEDLVARVRAHGRLVAEIEQMEPAAVLAARREDERAAGR